MTKLPRKEPLVKKFYFDLDTPNGPSKEFQRHGYQLIGETTFTLVHAVVYSLYCELIVYAVNSELLEIPLVHCWS